MEGLVLTEGLTLTEDLALMEGLALTEGLVFLVFRWFKFTLEPPYTVASGNLLSAIWDTSHWTSFVKFGLKTA